MCRICSEYKAKEITAKEAFAKIGDALQKASPKTTAHLLQLSDAILDSEVPMPKKDGELEKRWQEENQED